MSPRRCSRPACKRAAVHTLTYVYRDSTAVLGPLAAYVEPHCYDLCAAHADRMTVPIGWEVVRLPDGPAEEPGTTWRRSPTRSWRRRRRALAASPSGRVSRSAGVATCGCCVPRSTTPGGSARVNGMGRRVGGSPVGSTGRLGILFAAERVATGTSHALEASLSGRVREDLQGIRHPRDGARRAR